MNSMPILSHGEINKDNKLVLCVSNANGICNQTGYDLWNGRSMIVTFDIETLVYKCEECEYQFSIVGVWNSDMICGKQVAKHCPACGSENLEPK